MSIYDAALRELEQYRRDEAAGLLLRLPVPLGATVWSSHPAPHRGAYPLYPGSAGRLGKDSILHRG